MDKKEGYLKRLKNHPGLGHATFISILVICAGLSNKHINTLWHGLIIGCVGAVIIWSVVLISNFDRNG